MAGRFPSCGSVPDPENAITSPTFHVRLPGGETIVAVGGVLPTVMTIGSLMLEAPALSVTLSRAV